MSLVTMRRKFKRAEKPIQWLLVVVFAVSSVAFFSGYSGNQRAQADDAVIARVNGEEIPRELYERAMQINEQRMRMSNPSGVVSPEQEIQMRAAAFEMALTDTLRAQLARDQGVRVSDREAREEQKRLVEQALAGKLAGATADEKRAFEAKIRDAAFPLPLVKKSLMGQGLEKKIREETKPSDADLMKSFQEYKTRHILIKTDTRPEEEARRRAQEVLTKVRSGVGFDDLARKYSEDPSNKDKGGDLGWVGQKTGFVPEFKEALFKLSKGQVSEPVKTQFGFHIIKVDDVRSNLPKDINKPGKKAQYLKEYTDQLVQEKHTALIGKARTDAKIVAVDPFVKGYLTESDMLEAMQKGNQPLANQKLAEAIAAYEKAAVGRNGGAVIYTKLAELYQQAKQDDKAIAALQQAVSARANPQMAWQLGELLMKQKKNTEAVEAFKKAADGAYDMPWLRPQLAQRFKDLKEPKLAAEQQAKWEKWQKDNKGGGQMIQMPGGQTVQVEHKQQPVTPDELKKLKPEGGKGATSRTPAGK
jgi:parvulin-like peptidyl-prolyl isomerase